MVIRTVEQRVDDVDGSLGADNVTFTWKGTAYEIDLTAQNEQLLAKALAPFIARARIAKGGNSRRGSAASRSSKSRRTTARSVDLSAVRKWAAANDVTVADRGRVSALVVESYLAAQNHAVEKQNPNATNAPKVTTKAAAKSSVKKAAVSKAAPRRKPAGKAVHGARAAKSTLKAATPSVDGVEASPGG